LSRKEKRRLERLKKARQRKRILRCFIIIAVIFASYNRFLKNENKISNHINKEITPKKETTIEQVDETIETAINEKYEIIEYESEEKNDEKYIMVSYNDELIEESQEVKEIAERYIQNKKLSEENFGFFYYNPNNQKYYFYNADKYFTAASTIKVPLAIVYYDKINAGEISKDTTLLYNAEDYEEGSGATSSRYKPGNYIPVSYLLEQMIVNSDNTATQILKKGLGEKDTAYRNFITKYANRTLKSDFYIENVITPGYGYDVIKYLWTYQENYTELIEYMKKSSGGGYLKKGITTCEIAHKYGSYEGNIHDYGIVYSKENYLIGIFTKGVSNAENLISELNKEILKLHE